MPKPVAVNGDTKVETSTAKHQADTNQTGSWQLIKFTVLKGGKVCVQDKLVEQSATAAWQYIGGSTSSPPVPVGPFPDNAALNPGATVLTDGKQGILVDGDQATGAVDGGNKITVAASQKILSTA